MGQDSLSLVHCHLTPGQYWGWVSERDVWREKGPPHGNGLDFSWEIPGVKKRRRVKLSMIWGKILNPLLCVCVCDSRPQSCLTLCDPKDYSSSGSSVHGILQARMLEWVVIPFSRGIFPSQGSNPHLLHCRQILYHLSHQGSPSPLLTSFYFVSKLFLPKQFPQIHLLPPEADSPQHYCVRASRAGGLAVLSSTCGFHVCTQAAVTVAK